MQIYGPAEMSGPVAPPSVLRLSNGPDTSPARGEIAPAARFLPIASVAGEAGSLKLPISPLAGEMSGPFDKLRTEGGAKGRDSGKDCQ
jgi:hypothetical protein